MVKDNLKAIQNELPSGVKLVVVSKFQPLEAIVEAYEAGQRVFAESRPQEFAAKYQALCSGNIPIAAPDQGVKVASNRDASGTIQDIEWHFIGHLQTNKLKLVLPYADLIQSVDSVHLLDEIDKWGRTNGKVVNVLLEMHLGVEETKQGFAEEELLDLMFRVSDGKYPGVCVRGLMGMASNTDDKSAVDADFERIDSFMAYLVDLFPEMTDFNQLSIGMSGDWRIAVRHGATMVRIGTSIFGPRHY